MKITVKELYEKYDKIQLGYASDEIADYTDMLKYYPIEEQQKYKAIGMEIALVASAKI